MPAPQLPIDVPSAKANAHVPQQLLLLERMFQLPIYPTSNSGYKPSRIVNGQVTPFLSAPNRCHPSDTAIYTNPDGVTSDLVSQGPQDFHWKLLSTRIPRKYARSSRLGDAFQEWQASRSILTCFGLQPMLFPPAPAKLLSRNQN